MGSYKGYRIQKSRFGRWEVHGAPAEYCREGQSFVSCWTFDIAKNFVDNLVARNRGE